MQSRSANTLNGVLYTQTATEYLLKGALGFLKIGFLTQGTSKQKTDTQAVVSGLMFEVYGGQFAKDTLVLTSTNASLNGASSYNQGKTSQILFGCVSLIGGYVF
jgi:hypothetical protein